MLVRIERRSVLRSPAPPTSTRAQLVELVSPRTNGANYTPIEHLFAALAREGAVSLEIGGDATARRFYARFAQESVRGLLDAQLGAAYPQARVRQAAADPALLVTAEQVIVCALALREAEYLPLRIPRDTEIVADRAPQADPLLGVLAALGSMPRGWRAVSQLVLQPAPANWARRHLRRSLEHALAPERAEAARSGEGPGWGGVMLALVCLVAVVVLPRLWALYLSRGWLPVALVLVPVAVGFGGLYALWLRLSQRSLYDVDLVKEKLTHPAVRAQLRLAIFAPADAPLADVQARLAHLVAAYRAYDLERGNGLVARPLACPETPEALCSPLPIGPRRRVATLSTRELAGLWHLIQSGDDVALVERTTARRFLPLPETVADGARLGVAEDGMGRLVPVHLAPVLLRRHALLVAKTRKGKSGLLRRLWQQLVTLPTELAPTVVLVDPHSDLADAALGLVPPSRQSQVVHLNVGRAARRPFGLNLLDVGLGWSRDQLVENALRVFKHEFDNYWGPRMELVFRMALILLVEANERLVVADPSGGRDRQYTILEVPRVLEDDQLRGRLLAAMPDPQIRAMWRTYFTPLDHRFRLEIINAVQTKVYKFAANVVARSIVGQSRSTIDPQAWVRDGAIVVVDVAKEQVGADIAAMLGGTQINLVAIALGQQAALPLDQRRHVALLVDEFHALPAANYEAFLAELAKYGASLVLATQSLGALDTIDPQRGLRNAVFANVDHLFAFNCSAEDARSLALELGAPIEPADVVRDLVAAASGTRYGRDATVVADDRAAMLERLEVQAWSESSHEGGRSNTDPEGGRIPPASAGTVMGPPPPWDGQKRNQQRRARSSQAGRATGAPQLKLELHTQPAQAAAAGGPEHPDGGATDGAEVA